MRALERACRALVDAQSGSDDWDALTPEMQEQIRGEVRAVLGAVREPSRGLLKP